MEPSSEHNFVQRELVNWAPRSLVSRAGTPKREIHVCKKAFASVGVDTSGSGTASGHLVVLSTIVRRYLYPAQTGSGPTRSMLTEVKGK